MFKKILMLVCIFNFLSSCEYKPIYSISNKSNYQIIITDLSGDKKLNQYVVQNLKRNSQKNSNEIISITINSEYSKRFWLKILQVRQLIIRLELLLNLKSIKMEM